MIEALATMAIIVLTTTLAVPGMRDLVLGNRLASQVNTLVSALNYARSEAIGTAREVALCPYSVDASKTAADQRYRCLDSGNWSGGWMVARPVVDEAGVATGGQTVLKLFEPLGNGALDSSTSRVRFLPSGFLANATAPTFTLKPSDCRDQQQRRISLSLQGRPQVERSRCAA